MIDGGCLSIQTDSNNLDKDKLNYKLILERFDETIDVYIQQNFSNPNTFDRDLIYETGLHELIFLLSEIGPNN